MSGRPFHWLFATLGFELIPLKVHEAERQASARALESLERDLHEAMAEADRLARENEQAQRRLKDALDAARSELAEGRAAHRHAMAEAEEKAGVAAAKAEAEAKAHAEAVASLWLKVDRERSRTGAVEAANSALRQALEAANQRASEISGGVASLWARLGAERSRAERFGQRLQTLQAEHEQDVARRAAKLARAQAGRDAAMHKLDDANQRLTDTFARLTSLQAETDARIAELMERKRLEAARKSGIKARAKEESQRADRIAAENVRLAEEVQRLTRILASQSSEDTARVAGQVMESVALAGLRQQTSSGVAASSSRSAPGEDASAEEYFDLGRRLQVQGAEELAAVAYRRVGPRLKSFLTMAGPEGAPISGPDFLVIGAPRAGTTWLKQALSCHPDIYILSNEHHYFSQSTWLGPEAYIGRFAAADARFHRRHRKAKYATRSKGAAYGEKSTTYLAMPDANIDLCSALFPKARIICMVRDPVERAWSHVKHVGLREHAENLKALEDQPHWSCLTEFIRLGRYEEHLVRWARRYSPEQIMLVDFNRVGREPEAVLKEVLGHIGVELRPRTQLPERIGETGGSPMPDVLRRHLKKAFKGDRFDIPTLRESMARAAAEAAQAAEPEPEPRPRRPVRLHLAT